MPSGLPPNINKKRFPVSPTEMSINRDRVVGVDSLWLCVSDVESDSSAVRLHRQRRRHMTATVSFERARQSFHGRYSVSNPKRRMPGRS